MQKTFTANYMTRRCLKNTGQLDQYYIEHAHPAIIDPELWEAAQAEQDRASFCKAFNDLVTHRERKISIWTQAAKSGTSLQKYRAAQLIEITAGGTIPFEVPELTRAILQEAWLEGKSIKFILLTGDVLTLSPCS